MVSYLYLCAINVLMHYTIISSEKYPLNLTSADDPSRDQVVSTFKSAQKIS